MSTNAYRWSLVATVLVLAGGCDRDASEEAVSFSRDIQPVLDEYCSDCHTGDGAGVEASGFSTQSYEAVMTGTRLGPMIEPGDPLSSSLYRLVSGREVHPSIRMPHGEEKLKDSETALIESWIRQGAKDN